MLGLGNNLKKSGLITPGIITDSLVLKHNYNAGAVVPVSDGAAYFDASANNYVAIGNQSNLSFGTGSFSVACWVNSNQIGTTSFILGKGSSASTASSVGYALYLGNAGTDWVFSVGDGTDYEAVETTVIQNANQWYHLCGTFNGTSKQLKLYVDGVLIETDADTDIGDIDNSDAFDIGRLDASASNDWNGYICNVGVWSDVLTQAQIKSIMWKNYAGLTDSEKNQQIIGPQLITAIEDTDFSASPNWTAFDPDGGTSAAVALDSARWKVTSTTDTDREGTNLALANLGTLTAGAKYRITCDLQATSAGFTLTVGMGGAVTTQAITTSNVTYNIDLTIDNTSGSLRFYTEESTARIFHMDNITVHRLSPELVSWWNLDSSYKILSNLYVTDSHGSNDGTLT